MGVDNGNMAMLLWLPFHNRLVKKPLIFLRSTTIIVDLYVYNTNVPVSLYNVKG